MVAAGLLPKLVRIVTERGNRAQVEAAFTLCALCEHAQQAVEAGALDALVSRLGMPNQEQLHEYILGSLGTLAMRGAHLRNAIFERGVLPSAVDVIANADCDELVKMGTWALAAFFTMPTDEANVNLALPLIVELLCTRSDSLTLSDCLWCLVDMFSHTLNIDKLITDERLCKRLVELLVLTSAADENWRIHVITPLSDILMRYFEGFSHAHEAAVHAFVHSGDFLPNIVSCLRDADGAVVGRVCEIIETVVRRCELTSIGSDKLKDAMVQAGLLDVCADKLSNKNDSILLLCARHAFMTMLFRMGPSKGLMVHDNLLKALSSYGVPPAGVVSEADMKTWSDKSPKEIDDLLLHITQRNSNLYYTAKNSALYRHALDRQVDSEVIGFPSADEDISTFTIHIIFELIQYVNDDERQELLERFDSVGVLYYIDCHTNHRVANRFSLSRNDSLDTLAVLNARVYDFTSWQTIHSFILKTYIALYPLQLPPYVVLHILEFLPLLDRVSHVKKISLLIGLKKSMDRITNNRKTIE
eukprot:CAMPEP_0168584504 /NCGR_PEP_ID=MMETSP0420-20121227/3176_1 /TAXON_ID=498008 /ORGANISM="Pessonella sp." /LENGTH=529 /DNA_ID=CAMNT_0008619313 /DNA_START=681 /DNA_END=2270 /DNA_ORIENTATION=-